MREGMGEKEDEEVSATAYNTQTRKEAYQIEHANLQLRQQSSVSQFVDTSYRTDRHEGDTKNGQMTQKTDRCYTFTTVKTDRRRRRGQTQKRTRNTFTMVFILLKFNRFEPIASLVRSSTDATLLSVVVIIVVGGHLCCVVW